MRATWRAIGFSVVMLASSAWPCMAQSTPAAAPAAGGAATRPVVSAADMERFLVKADITATIRVSKGVTKARQVRMTDGTFTHDAQVQDVDISLPISRSIRSTRRSTSRIPIATTSPRIGCRCCSASTMCRCPSSAPFRASRQR